MKKCSFCGLEKEETEFFKKRENSLEGFCKRCKNEKLKIRISVDPEKFKEKEKLRGRVRRTTVEWKEWRKEHQKRNRDQISKKAVEYYSKNEKIAEQQKLWKKNNRDKLRQYSATARKKFPFKAAARSYVSAAIKEGILVRPEICSKCTKNCKAEAHHEDYTRPLEVIWLCRKCHAFIHRKQM